MALPYTDSTDPSAGLVEELLSRLDRGEEPQPPPQPKTWQKIVGSLGDAITARASVLAGGAPPRMGAFAAIQRENQEQYRIARARFDEEQQQLNNEILKFKIERAVEAETRGLKLQAELDKEARAQQAALDRLKAQDEINDDNRTVEFNRNARKWIKERAYELSRAGVPGMTDPSKLTVPDVINAAIGLDEAIAGKTFSDEERLAMQEKAVKGIFPDAEMTGVAYSTKEGVPNARFAIDPFKRLSATDARAAEKLGVKRFDDEGNPRTPQDISNEVTAKINEDRDLKRREREARLAATIKRGNGTKGTISEKILERRAMLRAAVDLKKLLKGTAQAPGGPVAGLIPPGMRYAMLEMVGKSSDINRDVTIALTGITNRIFKVRSGAAVTRAEEVRGYPELPKMTDSKETMLAKVGYIIDWETNYLKDAQADFKLTDEDMEFLDSKLGDPTFIPTQLESGDIVIFGGEQE